MFVTPLLFFLMSSLIINTLGTVLIVSLVSLAGIVFFQVNHDFLERILQYLISFSTGSLLGESFLHMIPEALEESASIEHALVLVLLGVVLSFILEQIIHWRHCHVLPSEQHHHPVGVLNLVGDSVHNFIDGTLIAAAFLVSPPLGFSTALAVALHELPQEIGDYAMLIYAGYSKQKALLWNLCSALFAVVGAVLVLALSSSLPAIGPILVPLAAGNFLYIAGSDLIPILHKENRALQALTQLLCLLCGIASMYSLTLLE